MAVIKKEIIQELYKSYRKHIFFGAILDVAYRDSIEIVENSDIQTARIFIRGSYLSPLSSKVTIEFSPKFYSVYIKTKEDILFLLSHEILHYILGHTTESPVYDSRYGRYVTNLAEDIIINQIIYREFGDTAKNLNVTDIYRKNRNEEGKILCPASLFLPPSEWSDEKNEKCRELQEMIKSNNINLERILKHIQQHNPGDLTIIEELVEASQIDKEILEHVIKYVSENIESRICKISGNDITNSARGLATIKQKLVELIKEISIEEYGKIEDICQRGVGVLPYHGRKDFVFLSTDIPPVIYSSNYLFDEGRSFRVYMDVSGSFYSHLPALFYLLESIRDWIAFPIYGFSTQVFPITKKDLSERKFMTTLGTDFDCVAEHILKNRFDKVILVTDGLGNISNKNIKALVSRCKILTLLVEGKKSTVKQFSYKVIGLSKLMKSQYRKKW
ncbi:MAG: hypothetical protein NZ927_01105 [Candidatus Calescibacterium sp.]|nr:hypothetical protein [Candidatus Calescibacterium sp.]